MSRLHEPTMELLAEAKPQDGGSRTLSLLLSPAPGWFHPLVAANAWCAASAPIGTLDVLGRRHLLLVPRGVQGFVGDALAGDSPLHGLASRAVGYRDPLATLDAQGGPADAAAIPGADPAAGAGASTAGRVFRAPTSGRFYGRPAPDKPPFVAPGTQLSQGTTVCLLEVMKTFNRVTYGGPGLPDTARVVRVLVAEGADVNAGEPLLELE